jgi:hypothetical protein
MQEILEKFLKMPISRTKEVFDEFLKIDGGIYGGDGLSSFLYIRGRRKNKVLLVAHADTVWDENYGRANSPIGLKLVFENGIYRNTFGGFGADDRAGCAILWLLKDLGHSLLITSGEEQGQIGSNFIMNENPDIANEINNEHQFIIQFDRRGSKDYKCYDVGTDEFRKYIESVTGYKEPNRESNTDIRILCRDICGVNLSIGYYNEHSDEAYLVYEEWLNTLNLAKDWLSKEDLPRFLRYK